MLTRHWADFPLLSFVSAFPLWFYQDVYSSRALSALHLRRRVNEFLYLTLERFSDTIPSFCSRHIVHKGRSHGNLHIYVFGRRWWSRSGHVAAMTQGMLPYKFYHKIKAMSISTFSLTFSNFEFYIARIQFFDFSSMHLPTAQPHAKATHTQLPNLTNLLSSRCPSLTSLRLHIFWLPLPVASTPALSKSALLPVTIHRFLHGTHSPATIHGIEMGGITVTPPLPTITPPNYLPLHPLTTYNYTPPY